MGGGVEFLGGGWEIVGGFREFVVGVDFIGWVCGGVGLRIEGVVGEVFLERVGFFYFVVWVY